ncbi:HNH endonuclease [Pseudomonas sp. URMO17WK12:I11]|uniref:HNH endonuclease n=1 Tax=Pseudomonas sp. URMO17WK12:I11 TaxID=1283291 RepID=UPI0011A2F1FC|nr:HNH endonuclease [Pseudomonas sp. URMO17WK12:I11]
MFNTSRTAPAPASLAARQKYDSADVYEALSEIFFDKCYICETKEPHDINVEHFDAHMKDLDKKFDWSNLYLACSRCNNIKRAEFNDILDCCDGAVDVFRAIKHVPPITPYAKSVRLVAMVTDGRTVRSCQLLEKVFNSDHTANKRVSGAFLRRKVFDQYNLLLDEIGSYYEPAATDVDKERALERMKVLIRRSAPYSAFIRWCILDDAELSEMLEGLMD